MIRRRWAPVYDGESPTTLAEFPPSIQRVAIMDNQRFDALVKRLCAPSTRRDGLRVLLSVIAAELLAFAAPREAAACKSRGDRCQKDNQCCSGQCVGRKPKNKKAKKGKRVRKNRKADADGVCDCSGLQERCKGHGDCCVGAHFCRATSCSDVPVCCKVRGAPCDDDCDCCERDAFCDDESGRCDDCGPLKMTRQGPCETADDCCFEDDICKSIDPACEGRAGDTQCCVPVGKACGEDCDCCVPLKCVSGACALQDGCSETGEACSMPGPDGCCVTGDVCSTAVCNDGVAVVCCHPSGPCDDDCDCCGPVECVNGSCGGSD